MLENNQLVFETIALKGGIGYASSYNKNGLYEVKISTGECKYIGHFKEPIDCKRLYSKALCIKNKVYFIPGAGRNISIYNLEDGSIEAVPVPIKSESQYRFYKTYMKFIDAIQQGNELWLIPSTYPGILRMNLDTNTFTNYDSWIPAEGYMFRSNIAVEGNSVIVPSGNSNLVLIFNLNNQTARVLRIGSENHGVMCMKKFGADYYLAPRSFGSIVVWNPSTNAIKEYTSYPDSFIPGSCVFSDIIKNEGRIIFVPMGANTGIVLDGGSLREDNTQWKNVREPGDIFHVFTTNTHSYYHEYRNDSSGRYFMMRISNGELSETSFRIINIEDDIRESLTNVKETGEVIYDEGAFGIKDILVL